MEIAERTAETFGTMQARRYVATLRAALRLLRGGPHAIGSKPVDEIAAGLRMLHAARDGRRARHVLYCRAVGERQIDVLRILHDAMNPALHLGAESDDGPRG